jgi:hypothetical protein
VQLRSAPGKQGHQVAAPKEHGGDFVLVELHPEVFHEGVEGNVGVALSKGIYWMHSVTVPSAQHNKKGLI